MPRKNRPLGCDDQDTAVMDPSSPDGTMVADPGDDPLNEECDAATDNLNVDDTQDPKVSDEERATPRRATRAEMDALEGRLAETVSDLACSQDQLTKCRTMLTRAIGSRFNIEDVAEILMSQDPLA